MQKSTANHVSRSKEIVWYLLGEYSLCDFWLDPEKDDLRTAGPLSKTVQELDIDLECVENIEMTLKSFATEALVHITHEGEELPGRIRVFCQRKIIDEKMKGGWGYFVIERSANSFTSDSTETHSVVEFYFYQEGE